MREARETLSGPLLKKICVYVAFFWPSPLAPFCKNSIGARAILGYFGNYTYSQIVAILWPSLRAQGGGGACLVQVQCDAIRRELFKKWHFSKSYNFWTNDLILILLLLVRMCVKQILLFVQNLSKSVVHKLSPFVKWLFLNCSDLIASHCSQYISTIRHKCLKKKNIVLRRLLYSAFIFVCILKHNLY